LFAILVIFTHFVAAANAPIREVTSQAAELPGMLIPAFYKGYIYWAGREPLRIYAPDGRLVYIPEPRGTVEAIAADTDGAVALAWHAEAAGYINLHDASGALVRTIATGRYLATHLAFAEDHSLWSLGWQVRYAKPPMMPDTADYMIVRRYLPNGDQAGAYLPRSLFPRGLEPGMDSWQRSNSITVGHDTIGLWVTSGMDSNKTEWVELDLHGNLTGRWRLDPFSYEIRVAFASDGHIFVQHANMDAKTRAVTYSLLTLDRASSTWRPIPSAPSGKLVGAEGETLIFADFGTGPIHLRWYQHP
jgi:hypothetical protein